MGKKRRARRALRKPPAIDAGPSHPPWGATEQQSSRYQLERDYKNRIHQLERLNAELLDKARCYDDLPIGALTRLCGAPVAPLVAAGVDVASIVDVAVWLSRHKKAAGQ